MYRFFFALLFNGVWQHFCSSLLLTIQDVPRHRAFQPTLWSLLPCLAFLMHLDTTLPTQLQCAYMAQIVKMRAFSTVTCYSVLIEARLTELQPKLIQKLQLNTKTLNTCCLKSVSSTHKCFSWKGFTYNNTILYREQEWCCWFGSRKGTEHVTCSSHSQRFSIGKPSATWSSARIGGHLNKNWKHR